MRELRGDDGNGTGIKWAEEGCGEAKKLNAGRFQFGELKTANIVVVYERRMIHTQMTSPRVAARAFA